jgi:hypothetical protein
MSEYIELGSQLRDLLRGLLGVMEPQKPRYLQWGPRIDYSELPDLYAPQDVKPFFPTPGGIDNLHLSSTDTFYIPEKGEFTVDFKGYMRVARSNPTTNDWDTCEVFVNMLDLRLVGKSQELGEIKVSLNDDFVAAGQVFPTGEAAGTQAAAACRIAAPAVFDVPAMGFGRSADSGGLFNKEPVLLMNDGIEALPPVEDPNGYAHIYKLPLFDRARPDARPIAYITSLKYTVGGYVTKKEAEHFRSL